MSVNTPCFIFDIDKLNKRCEPIKALADESGIGLCYAIKANGFLTPYMLDFTKALEVCSHGELKLCKKQGIPMERIILSGVNKEEAFVEDGILSGVGIITAESSTHFEYINKYAKLHNRTVRVILRLSCGAQFGMDRAVLEDIIKTRGNYPNIIMEGIHYFTGTQKKKLSRITKELETVFDLVKDLKEAYGYKTGLIEYGPGLGVPYFEGDDFSADMELYQELIDWISHNKPQGVDELNLEMGRFFVASCGTYITSIADIKTNEDLNVCIIDGGKNHLSYYGQNMALKTPIIRHESTVSDDGNGQKTGEPYTIFGSLCSFNDIIARDVVLSNPQIGDRLIFENTGAYSVTEGLYLFLSRPMPDIYLKEGGELTLARSSADTFHLNG